MHLFAKCENFTTARELRAVGLYPYFQRIESSADTEVVIDGHRKVMVGSNNYMGLTHDPRIIEAAKQALDRYGSGNTGSRFLNGNLDLHDRLETLGSAKDELRDAGADLLDWTVSRVSETDYHTRLGARLDELVEVYHSLRSAPMSRTPASRDPAQPPGRKTTHR